jgi:hypothetical protein
MHEDRLHQHTDDMNAVQLLDTEKTTKRPKGLKLSELVQWPQVRQKCAQDTRNWDISLGEILDNYALFSLFLSFRSWLSKNKKVR